MQHEERQPIPPPGQPATEAGKPREALPCQPPKRPPEPLDKVEEASIESFPASDAPGY